MPRRDIGALAKCLAKLTGDACAARAVAREQRYAAAARAQPQCWDGRKDSQWAQALGPLESPVEHGGTRAQYAHVVAEHYGADYERIFKALPDLAGIPPVAGPVDDPAARAAWASLSDAQRDAVTGVYVNIGKAIAAYERRIQYGPSRFDRYLEALQDTGRAPEGVMSRDEVAGLRLFAGKASCINCHNGPLLTNNEFHNTGVSARAGLPPDAGRLAGHVMMMMHGRNVSRPAPAEFGNGPRPSAARQFTATLQPDQPLRPRRMQTVRVAITDAAGRPVDDATIEVDGGMPQHGHGLPTRPRVTRRAGVRAFARAWRRIDASRSRTRRCVTAARAKASGSTDSSVTLPRTSIAV